MPVYNTHERRLNASPDEVGALLDALASDDDRLWPCGSWPAMVLDGPLAPGASGGHGPVRYTVEHYVPGRWVRLRFGAPRGFDGFHELTVRPDPSGGTVLAHLLAMRAHGPALVAWPLVFRPLHDALLEDALDRAEQALHGSVRTPARWSARVRLLRAVLARTAPARRPRTPR
ncbi:SRPBCC family protein [Nocardiopsis sp. YSL2]|uniref:SRPBCC family protein n=1 Tax=Nocardiopsis sp. YSL2 TaxID=2939492 RepID=UPI0026F43954|nr:SRPBCC family protein [Nocardiopsis sp. YSL2]